MPDGGNKGPEIPRPSIASSRRLEGMRSDVNRILGSTNPLDNKILPQAIPTGTSIPALETVVRQENPPGVPPGEIKPPHKSVSDFVEAVKTGNIEGIAEAGSRITKVLVTEQEPFKKEEHLYVAYDNDSDNPSDWTLDKLKGQRDMLQRRKEAGETLNDIDRSDLNLFEGLIGNRLRDREAGAHGTLDVEDYEQVSHYLSGLRKERVMLFDEVRVRESEEFQQKFKNDPVFRKEIIDAEKARLEKVRQKKVEQRQIRIDKARAAGAKDYHEDPVPPVKFNEKDFDPTQGRYVPESELLGSFTSEERARLDGVDTQIEKFALLNEEKLEYLASPERGIAIAKEIMHWEGLRKQGSYNEIDWEALDRANDDQIIHTEAIRIISLRVKYQPEREIGYEEEPKEQKKERFPVEEEALRGRMLIGQLYELALSGERLSDEFYRDANAYFEQAKRAGVLEEVDKVLSSVYTKEVVRGIRQGLTVTEIMSGIPGATTGADRAIMEAEATTARIFKMWNRLDRKGEKKLDPLYQQYEVIDADTGRKVLKEVGVWQLYTLLATERMLAAADAGDEDQGSAIREYIEHEFNLDKVPYPSVQERYWRPSPGGWSIEVYAKTPGEYFVAADTYIADAQARTTDPSEVFQDVTQFIKQIDMSTGHQSAEFVTRLRHEKGASAESKTDSELVAEFRKELTIMMQARIGVGIADHANELYHGSQYKQGMDYMAKDGEGPARWLSLMKLPGVAEALWKLDNDPRYEAMFALYGSRGQLASDSAAQNNRAGGLFNQVEHVLVEELLGTRMKDEGRRGEVAKDMPEKKFTAMFDGLYEYGKVKAGSFQGDGNLKVYRRYGELTEREAIQKVPKSLREAYHLGRIQHLLRPVKPTDGGPAGAGYGHHDLDARDKRRLAEAEAKIKKAVHIAMEIYGALGEKSKRGGGVFKVYKGKDAEGREIYDYVSTHQGEKFAQMAETVTEMRYADDSDVWDNIEALRADAIGVNIKGENFKARYRAAKVAQARGKALDEFAGVEMKFVPKKGGGYERNADNEYILHNLTAEDRKLLTTPVKNLNPEERDRLAELNVIRRGGKGFQAKLYEYDAEGNRTGEMRIDRPFDIFDPKTGEQRAAKPGDVIGYNGRGEEVKLQFDGQGKLVGVEYDKDGKAVLYRSKDSYKLTNETDPEKQRKKIAGERINMHLNQSTGSELKQMPTFDKDGRLKFVSVLVEKAAVDFALANSHFYGDWTSHTYWSYQEEDRNLLLSQKSFAEARQIRAGTLRPEDASIWARQLLLLDPTLLRVMKFTATRSEDHERKMTMAMVEHKYQSHWRISRDLHHAFFPTTGSPSELNGLYYGLQDFGGYRKMLESARAQIGEDPERFARRGKRLIPDLHIPYAAASEMWGAGSKGVMGVMRMFNAPVYRAVGTMALDKFAAQSDAANKMRSALVESRTSDGGYAEALLLKPTNNSDKASSGLIPLIPSNLEDAKSRIKAIYRRMDWRDAGAGKHEGVLKNQGDFAYSIIESLGRYRTYMQLFPLIETGIRNAPGAFWFASDAARAKDVIVGDIPKELTDRMNIMPVVVEGEEWNAKQQLAFERERKAVETLIDTTLSPKLNRAELDNSKSPDTGSSRHSGKIFHDIFGEFLVEQGFRGGGQLYGGERFVYSRIYDPWLEPNSEGKPVESGQDIWSFILTKLIPT